MDNQSGFRSRAVRSFHRRRSHLSKQIAPWRERYLLGYVLIHINKTGGSSIERALGLPLRHWTAVEKRDQLGPERWAKKFTFAFVRNPWDKVVSHYQYRIETNQTEMGDGSLGFKEWVTLAYGERDPRYYNGPRWFMPQVDWISDADGTRLVNFVGRFERLEADFDYVREQIGTGSPLPHMKASSRGPYQDYYDDETREIIRRSFAPDLEAFGYDFET